MNAVPVIAEGAPVLTTTPGTINGSAVKSRVTGADAVLTTEALTLTVAVCPVAEVRVAVAVPESAGAPGAAGAWVRGAVCVSAGGVKDSWGGVKDGGTLCPTEDPKAVGASVRIAAAPSARSARGAALRSDGELRVCFDVDTCEPPNKTTE
jgi:hypothetical protein